MILLTLIIAILLLIAVTVWTILELRKTTAFIKNLKVIKCTLCNSKEITKHEAGHYYCDKH